ncbi:type IV pili twitching motility protein PilT, partial [Kingella kingae]|nr:type IV pili twitching motility protein PilT [Kingella kingae]
MQVTIPPINEEMRKFIHGLLTHMVNNKGSDLFITAGYPPAMKLDGKLTKITDKPLTADHAMQIARSIMDDKQAEEFLTTNECNFAISLPGVSRFRINAMVPVSYTHLRAHET